MGRKFRLRPTAASVPGSQSGGGRDEDVSGVTGSCWWVSCNQGSSFSLFPWMTQASDQLVTPLHLMNPKAWLEGRGPLNHNSD